MGKLTEEMVRRRHDSSVSPPRRAANNRRDSSRSSSPSPARESLKDKASQRRQKSASVEKSANTEKRAKVRPGIVSTVRLYSNSPSPPPQVESWKNKEKRDKAGRRASTGQCQSEAKQ